MTYSYVSGARSGLGVANVRFPSWIIVATMFSSALIFSALVVSVLNAGKGAGPSAYATPYTPSPQPVVTYAQFEELPQLKADDLVSEQIEEAATAWIAAEGRGSQWSYSLQGVDNDVHAADNENAVYNAASIYKLYLLKPLLNEVPFNTWDTASVGDRSLKECVDAMLDKSDNPCAEAIASTLGWGTIGDAAARDGYNVMYQDGGVVSTAQQTSTLMKRLFKKSVYGEQASSFLLESLSRDKSAEAIRKSCANCSDIYNKTGEISSVKHDAAIIVVNGKSYALTIFSNNTTWSQAQDFARVITQNL